MSEDENIKCWFSNTSSTSPCEEAIATLSSREHDFPLCKSHLKKNLSAVTLGFKLKFLDKVEEVLYNLDGGTV